MDFKLLCVAAFTLCAIAHDDNNQRPIAGPHKSLWYNSLNAIPGDGGTQVCLSLRLRSIG